MIRYPRNPSAACPNCGHRISLSFGPLDGLEVICPACGSDLEVSVDHDGVATLIAMVTDEDIEEAN